MFIILLYITMKTYNTILINAKQLMTILEKSMDDSDKTVPWKNGPLL